MASLTCENVHVVLESEFSGNQRDLFLGDRLWRYAYTMWSQGAPGGAGLVSLVEDG